MIDIDRAREDGINFALQNLDTEDFNYHAGIHPSLHQDKDYVNNFEFGFDETKIYYLASKRLGRKARNEPADLKVLEETKSKYFLRKESSMTETLAIQKGKDWAGSQLSKRKGHTIRDGLESFLQLCQQQEHEFAQKIALDPNLRSIFEKAFIREAKKAIGLQKKQSNNRSQ